MLSRIRDFVNTRKNDIILLITIILVSLLSFAIGFILANQKKEPIKVEYYNEKSAISHSSFPGR